MKQQSLLERLNILRKKSKLDKPKASQFIDRAYDGVISIIKGTYKPDETITKTDVVTLPLTENMKAKLLSTFDRNFVIDNNLAERISKYLGIGPKKAEELVRKGLTKPSQLKQKKWLELLPSYARVLITHAPRTNFPRSIIAHLEAKLVGYPDAEIILVGSYRRQLPYCNDIDIMLVSNSVELGNYIEYLGSVIPIHVYNNGRDRVSFLIRIGSNYYKADVFRTSIREKYASLLYATGSREFNIRIRALAKKKGYLLNQHGLFKGSSLVPQRITSERDIFDKLGVQYLSPKDR